MLKLSGMRMEVFLPTGSSRQPARFGFVARFARDVIKTYTFKILPSISSTWKALRKSCSSEACALRNIAFARAAPHSPRFWYATLKGSPQYDTSGGHAHHGARPLQYQPNNFLDVVESRDVDSWIALLDRGLPHHLRLQQDDNSAPNLGAADIAEILLTAQRSVSSDIRPGHDVLFVLGTVYGRWDAVIWLVKQLLEEFGPDVRKIVPSSPTSTIWPDGLSLEDLTRDSIELDTPPRSPSADGASSKVSPTLNEHTNDQTLRRDEHGRSLSQDALGQIWRSLGSMIIARVDEEVQPEVLEIIALLHHQELMPRSIYNQKPGADSTAIQQPPTLHLLSSRILTSLSDAAWRAHAKLVVEEAKSKGGSYASLRPEIPGMAYRVRVAGLRPEVWLELILWSCLHGGWYLEGAEILRIVCREEGQHVWRPLSWRVAVPFEQDSPQDWHALDLLLNQKPASTMDEEKGPVPNVRRTVSSEVVNAYVDALISGLDFGASHHKAKPAFVLDLLKFLRQFLERSNLTLGAGSWDAVVLRYVESQGTTAIRVEELRSLQVLSPQFGSGLDSDNVKELPSYVLDGSAAMLGLYHLSLNHYMKAGDLSMTLRILQRLQDYTDSNKRRSLEDFFRTIRSHDDNNVGTSSDLFTSNYKIDYPAFDNSLPTTILSHLLELATEAKAYDIGRWMLSRNDLDGVMIPEHIYSDPIMLPAMVRFATATNDQALLSKLVELRSHQNKEEGTGPTLPWNVLQSFLDAQIRLQRWSAARRILELMHDAGPIGWNVGHLALLAQVLMQSGLHGYFEPQGSTPGSPMQMFVDMVDGKYDHQADRDEETQQKIDTLLIVLSSFDRGWANHCCNRKRYRSHFYFRLNIKWFNWILEGLTELKGSLAARCLVESFWPQAAGVTRSGPSALPSEGNDTTVNFSSANDVRETSKARRFEVHLRGDVAEKIVMYGGVQPDFTTIRIILRHALQEFKSQRSLQAGTVSESHSMNDDDTTQLGSSTTSYQGAEAMPRDDSTVDGGSTLEGAMEVERAARPSASDMVIWAAKHLRTLGMVDEDVRAELAEMLVEHDMCDLKESLARLFQEAKELDDVSIEPFDTEPTDNDFHRSLSSVPRDVKR